MTYKVIGRVTKYFKTVIWWALGYNNRAMCRRGLWNCADR